METHILDWQRMTTKKATSKSKTDTITAMLAAAAAAANEFGREKVLENKEIRDHAFVYMHCWCDVFMCNSWDWPMLFSQ